MLEQTLAEPNATVLACHQLAPELAERAAKVERLILIDSTTDRIAGEIKVEKVEPLSFPPPTFSHNLSPATFLACAQELYGASPETWLVIVSSESFEHTDALSVTVEKRLPEIVALVQKLTAS